MSVEGLGDGGPGDFLVDERFAGGEGDHEGLQAEVVDRAGEATRCDVEEGDRVVGEQLVAAAGEAEVMLDVTGCPGGRHAGHRATQGGPLSERGQDGEFHGPPQGRLANRQAGQRRVLVHGRVDQHPDRIELSVVEQVGFVEDQDGGAAAPASRSCANASS